MSADCWKLTLPCTRAEAEAIAAADLQLDAVLMTSEVDEATAAWRLDAYFDGEPQPETVAAIRELAASGGWSSARPEPVADADWVTLSQTGLEPIREGRFIVQTAAHNEQPPAGGRAFLIDAGRAFGTGHHHTTAGCLAMLDDLADRRFDKMIDIGTGTGLLAFAAAHLWPQATIMATDIDTVAIEVARQNATLNTVTHVSFLAADGTHDQRIASGGPYDLIIANILAGPLIAMASEITAIAAPSAIIILAGLLDTQRLAVMEAYEARGCTLEASERRGDWTILRLRTSATGNITVSSIDRSG